MSNSPDSHQWRTIFAWNGPHRWRTIFAWNGDRMVIRQMPIRGGKLVEKVAMEMRAGLHDAPDDPRWKIVEGMLVVDEMLLDARGNRSIFDDVDK